MPAPPRKRLPPEQRIAQIVDASATIFAEKGFSASTRELAAEIGVTQALLYRYFPSKEKLIEEVFRRYFLDRWQPEWAAILTDRGQPLEQRLCRFYEAFLQRGTPTTMRLFLRANLDGLDLAKRYGIPLTERILAPLVEELRHEAKVSDLAAKPLLAEERELALVLHGSIMFSRIRRHIYRAPIASPQPVLIALHVTTFLPGAIRAVRALHAK